MTAVLKKVLKNPSCPICGVKRFIAWGKTVLGHFNAFYGSFGAKNIVKNVLSTHMYNIKAFIILFYQNKIIKFKY